MQTLGRRCVIALVFMVGVLALVATSPADEDRCQTDGDVQRCDGACEALAAVLREPLTPPPTTTGRCVRFEGRVGCGCFADDDRDLDGIDGDDLRLPRDAFIDDGSCAVFGRFGECLYDPADFPGCTIAISQGGVVDDEGSDAICADVCTTVDERRQAAAAARPGATVEASLCDLACACRIRDGETCAIAGDLEQLPADVTPDEANDQVRFNACPPGDL